MEAGLELDKLVAEKVMDWEFLAVGYFGDPETETPRQVELEEWLDKVGIESVGDYYIDVERNFWVRATDGRGKAWHPSTDIAAAWEVVEKMCNASMGGSEMRLHGCGPADEGNRSDSGEWWIAELLNCAGKNAAAMESTAPLTICLAALKAKGVEVE